MNAIYDKISVIFLGVLAVVLLSTAKDYGYSWDEVTHNRWYGQAVLNFILTWGQDKRALTTSDFYLYGGMFDTLAELLPRVTPLDGFTSRRFANVLVGFLGFVGSWRLGRLAGGPQAGFWALLLLTVSPPWYGHVFINAKDIPFAVGYLWSIYFVIVLLQSLPEIHWRT